MQEQNHLQYKYQQQHHSNPLQHLHTRSSESYTKMQHHQLSPVPIKLNNLPLQQHPQKINSDRPFSYHKPSQSQSNLHPQQCHIAPPSKDIKGVSSLSRLQPFWKKIGESRDKYSNDCNNSARVSSGYQSVSPIKCHQQDQIFFSRTNNDSNKSYIGTKNNQKINNIPQNSQHQLNPLERNHKLSINQQYHNHYHPSSCDPFDTHNSLKNNNINKIIKHQNSYDHMYSKNITEQPFQQQQLPWQQCSPSTATVSPVLNPSQSGSNSMVSSAGLISHLTDSNGVVEWTIDQVEEYQRNQESQHPQRILENIIVIGQNNSNKNNLNTIKDTQEQIKSNNNTTSNCMTFGSIYTKQLPFSSSLTVGHPLPPVPTIPSQVKNQQDQNTSSHSSFHPLNNLNNCNDITLIKHQRYHSSQDQYQNPQPISSSILQQHNNKETYHQIPQLFPNSSINLISTQIPQNIQQLQQSQQQQPLQYPSSMTTPNNIKPQFPFETSSGVLYLNYNYSTYSTLTNSPLQCHTARETTNSQNNNTPNNSSPYSKSNHHRIKPTPPVKHTMPQSLFNSSKLHNKNSQNISCSNPQNDTQEINQVGSLLSGNQIISNNLNECLPLLLNEGPKLSQEICSDYSGTPNTQKDYGNIEILQDNPCKTRRRSPLRSQVFNGSNSKQPQQIDLRLHSCLEDTLSNNNNSIKPEQSIIQPQIQQQKVFQSDVLPTHTSSYLPTQIVPSMINTALKQSVPSQCELEYWNMFNKNNHTYEDQEELIDLKELKQQHNNELPNNNKQANKSFSLELIINANNSHGIMSVPINNNSSTNLSNIPSSEKQPIYSNKDYHFIRQIGKGKYSEVFLAQDKQTGFLFAVKQVEKAMIIELSMEEQFSAELKNHMLLIHPNILRLYGFTTDENFFYLFMEYAPDGDVQKLLKEQLEGMFSEPQAGYYLAQLASALDYLHSKKIIHRDLKPDNLLISNGILKLGDFGYSRYCDRFSTRDTFCGTLDYLSPQVVKGEKYNQSTDVWSFGVIAYEMMQGIAPFYENSKEATMEKIESGEVKFNDRISCQGKQFIQELLAMKGEQRKTMKQVCLDRWLVEKVQEYEMEIKEKITLL